MKVIIFILLLFANTCYAQTGSMRHPDSLKYKAGAEFIKFSKIHFTGATVETIGVVITLYSATVITNDEHKAKQIASVGAIVSFVGVIIEATSYKHIKRAGIILEGNGISIPLGHRKKHHAGGID